MVAMKEMTVTEVPLDSLDALGLLRDAPFQSSVGWWRCVAREALPSQAHTRFLLVCQGGRPALFLPMMARDGRVEALTTPYTCLYQPIASPECDFEAAGALLAAHFGSVLRLDAIDRAWPGWDGLISGWRRARYLSLPFDGFANWREPICGRGWAGYLADRPGSLRETIRRRLGQAERDPAIAITMVRVGSGVRDGFADYESVHARSWKPREPFPGFWGACLREAEAIGCLRIAVLRSGERPIAAQYWTVEKGVATLHKLVHDDDAGSRSPGTVLTAWAIRRLIEEEDVAVLDFGRGDDPYKQSWTTQRSLRGGMLIVDPLSAAGSLTIARQTLGSARRRLTRTGGRGR